MSAHAQLSLLSQIYQSCLATFLTFASKSCGPSYAANKPPGICWLYTFPFQTLNMSLLEKKKEKEKKNTNMANLKRPPLWEGPNYNAFSRHYLDNCKCRASAESSLQWLDGLQERETSLQEGTIVHKLKYVHSKYCRLYGVCWYSARC